MTNKKQLTSKEIHARIKSGIAFKVHTTTQRNKAYDYATIFEKEISAPPNASGGYDIIFVKRPQ